MLTTPNKPYEIEIESVIYGGSGIGTRPDGKKVFVSGVLPGERVLVKNKKEKNDYVRAELLKILRTSQERIKSNCLLPVGTDGTGTECFAEMPGCPFQEFSYEEEIRIKNAQFASFIGESTEILPPVPSPLQLHYRNKIVLHMEDDHGVKALGYRETAGQDVVDVLECPLALEPINDKLCELRKKPGFLDTFKHDMSFTLRYTENDGVLHWRNNPAKKATWLKENTVLGKISVPPGGFFQVNPALMSILVEKTCALIREIKPEAVFDLYCGCGLFSIAAAASGVPLVTGLDCDEAAVKAAEYNASSRKIKTARFSAGPADKIFRTAIEAHSTGTGGTLSETLLIIDPPRSGLGRSVRNILRNTKFKAIIYISCAPDTLARDLHSLSSAGYTVASAQMLDMFPRTAHFESLILLTP